jgi:peroxiredoxin
MGKAARLKQQRRIAQVKPPPVGKQRPVRERMQLVWAGTGAVVVLVAVVVGVLLATRSSANVPSAAPPSAADRDAPAALIQAADAVDFHPTTEPGTGEMEGQPASAGLPPANPHLLAVGTTAPSFTLRTPQGKSVSLTSYRGKVVLLEFFATWCPHCNAEAPHLRTIYASLGHNKFAFVSVNADGEDAASVFAFHRYFGLLYPALLDPSRHPGSFHQEGAAGPVSTEYKVEDFPTFYILDRQGRITWRNDGEQPDALLRQELLRAARA